MVGVVAGGALGALLRVVAELLAGDAVVSWLTLVAVNVLGSFLLGLVYARRAGRVSPALGAGLLGGFTSFSGWALDVVWLWGSAPALALGVGLVVPLACLGACLAGLAAGELPVGRSG